MTPPGTVRPVRAVARVPASAPTRRLLWARRLAVACVVLTFLLMVLGSWVKATGSGLSCPDWPRCYGQWFPPFPSVENGGAWDTDHDGVPEPVLYTQAQELYEWAHRAVASLISVPVLAFALVAGRERTFRPALRGLAWTALGLLLFQATLGAVTVRLGNTAWATTMHLATATLFFGTLVAAACFAFLAPLATATLVQVRPAAPHPAFAPSGTPIRFVYPGEESARPPREGPDGQ